MTSKRKMTSGRRNLKWLLVVVVTALSLFVGWITANNYWIQPREDRELFSNLERALDNASGQIADVMRITKEKSCSRAQEKYGRGALICSIKLQIPTKHVKPDSEGVWRVFDSTDSFQKQGGRNGQLQQYTYEDVSCSVESSTTYYTIVCGRVVARSIY